VEADLLHELDLAFFEDRFEGAPPDQENRDLYDELHDIYPSLYPATREAAHELTAIQRRWACQTAGRPLERTGSNRTGSVRARQELSARMP
jgi:hypothetical protein